MLGFYADALSGEITMNPDELEDARWFTRAEVQEAMTRGADSTTFVAPPPTAIANHLLKWWLEQDS